MTSRRGLSRWVAFAVFVALAGVLGITVSSPPVSSAEPPDPRVVVQDEPVAFLAPVDEAPTAISLAQAPLEVPVPQTPMTEAPVESPAPLPAPEPCGDTLAWVAAAGLPLPAGVGYHCPSAQFAHHGAACWNNGTYCPRGGFIAINMDLLAGTSTDYLRHVVAHEVCHILEFQATGRSTEAGADACAAAHGAP